ncbi:hypothetical protein M407DRAFT_30084 [Tulasnella calospora MUT 4182]|uniref:Peptidase S1 domain-containing protein n=1 Tax=Tulasnella calospora MUT 4182 TaxID=1051891 RepID=A0A0C3LFK4_9AGAM|nr:hypothetical protein M407DRAFT_30084 [Tulasnella calospora MUT 4182]
MNRAMSQKGQRCPQAFFSSQPAAVSSELALCCPLVLTTEFYSLCVSVAESRGNDGPPLSPTSTLATSSVASSQGDVEDRDLQHGNLSPPSPSNVYPGAYTDFYGFPSFPLSIYKTGDAWPVPTGIEAYRVPREARPVGYHPIQEVWDSLGVTIYKYLDSQGIMWSSIDPVRFAEQGGIAGPLHLWIGIEPKTLSFDLAVTAAHHCKEILTEHKFGDVEIAFRESTVTRSVGPRLLDHGLVVDSALDLRSPFTSALGVQIAPLDTHYEGTGGLYFRESRDIHRLWLLTNRHVALPPSEFSNELYHLKKSSQPAREMIVLGPDAFTDAVQAIMNKIGQEVELVKYYKDERESLGEDANDRARNRFQRLVANAEEAIVELTALHSEITQSWMLPMHRKIGYVLYAPPISTAPAPELYTEDWAMLNLYVDKFVSEKFKGNIAPYDFVAKMHPHPTDQSSFKYPRGGLLQVTGVLSKEEIRKPTQLDANGEKCILAIKNGGKSGVTVGRATGIESFVRVNGPGGLTWTSREIAVYSYSKTDGPFSAPGDSGSIVVNWQGRIIGQIHAGAGSTDSTDVTYLTPFHWLLEQIKKAFPDAFLYQIQS